MTTPTDAAADLARRWRDDGVVVVPRLLAAERVARLARICDAVMARWRRRDSQTGKPGGGPDAHVMRHLNHADQQATAGGRR